MTNFLRLKKSQKTKKLLVKIKKIKFNFVCWEASSTLNKDI